MNTTMREMFEAERVDFMRNEARMTRWANVVRGAGGVAAVAGLGLALWCVAQLVMVGTAIAK